MNILWVLLLSVLSLAASLPTSANALNEFTSFKNLKYVPAQKIPAKNAPELRQISAYLETRGLHDISHGMQGFLNRYGLDQIFVSPDLSRAVFLRFDLQPAEGKNAGLTATDGTNSYVAHGRTKLGTSYTAMFLGYKSAAINPVLLGLKKDLSGYKSGRAKTSLLHFFLQPARAAEDDEEDEGAGENKDKKITCQPNSILSRGWGPMLKSLGWKCVFDAVSAGKYLPLAAKWGVGGAALGAMETIGDEAIKGSVQKGIDGSFLDAAKKHYETFVANITNIRSVLRDHLETISMLPESEQQTIWCRLAGLATATGGSAAAVVAGTGGAAAPLGFIAATAIMEAYSQMEDVQEHVEKVRKQCKLKKPAAPAEGRGWVDPPARKSTVTK